MLLSDNEVAETAYVSLTLGRLVEASGRFHSRHCLPALQSMLAIYDDLIDVLQKAIVRKQVIFVVYSLLSLR